MFFTCEVHKGTNLLHLNIFKNFRFFYENFSLIDTFGALEGPLWKQGHADLLMLSLAF